MFSRHRQIISCLDTSCCTGASVLEFHSLIHLHTAGCPPVCHNDSVKSPFISRNGCQQIFIIGRMDSVDEIVGCHNGHRFCFFDCKLESLQINLTSRSLTDVCIRVHSVIFLIIQCEMFDSCANSGMLLYAQCICCRTFPCNKRILGIIFEVTSAQRISVNIHPRCQPQCHTEFFHLFPDNISAFFDCIHIPCLGKQCGNRDCSTVLIIVNGIFRNLRLW